MTDATVADDPSGWAGRLGVSRDAIDLFMGCEVIDLHVESFVWSRVFGYDLRARHRHGLPGHRWWGQVDGLIVPPRDLPTVLELPRLAQRMLDRGYGTERVRKILGANYLRVVAAVRPGPPAPGVEAR